MGYAWSGVCYESGELARDAFASGLSTLDGYGVTVLTGAPTVDGVGQVSWSVTTMPWSTGVSVARSGVTQLQACAVPTAAQYPVQSVLIVAALFFAMVMGFRAGFRA